MSLPQNDPPQLAWTLPQDLDKLPPEVAQIAASTGQLSMLTMALSAAATLLLAASSSPLTLAPVALALASALSLQLNRSGLVGPARALLLLATSICTVALLSLSSPSPLDALALAPAALVLGTLGRKRSLALLVATVLPLTLVAALRGVAAPLPTPALLSALGPICVAAVLLHAAWRKPLEAPPVVLAEPKPAPPPVVVRQAPAPGQALRVLVVDDIPINRMVVQRMLQARGLTVLEASSGADALEVLEQNEVDLVLLDLHMPGLDGIEVARRIRARGDRVPLVALTADSVAGTREACLAAGMDAFLNKPAPPQVLFQLVEGLTLLQQKTAS